MNQCNTEIPTEFERDAVCLAGEYAWPADKAEALIRVLSERGCAVIGVELWRDEGGMPKVIGWSEYEVQRSDDWDRYVRLNEDEALKVVRRIGEEDILYNLTWISKYQ
jgi:hypothetical protein